MKTIKLKNGAIVPEPALLTSMVILKKFVQNGDSDFLYELYRKAENSDYEIQLDYVTQKLSQYTLIDRYGNIPNELKDVIISYFILNEETLEFTFQSPVASVGQLNANYEYYSEIWLAI